jgi:hypothetical protein
MPSLTSQYYEKAVASLTARERSRLIDPSEVLTTSIRRAKLSALTYSDGTFCKMSGGMRPIYAVKLAKFGNAILYFRSSNTDFVGRWVLARCRSWNRVK